MDTKTDHTIRLAQSSVTVPAEEAVPGLFIYKILDHVDALSHLRWRIGHHSGLVIAAAWSEGDARLGAETIAPLANWSLAVDELRDAVDITDLYEQLRQVRCHHTDL